MKSESSAIQQVDWKPRWGESPSVEYRTAPLESPITVNVGLFQGHVVRVEQQKQGTPLSNGQGVDDGPARSPLATAVGPNRGDRGENPQIYRSRDGQVLFPSRRGQVDVVEATFVLQSCTAITYRGDPIKRDDRSLYLTLVAREPATSTWLSRLKGNVGNAAMTIRVGSLRSPTNEWDQPRSWLTPKLLAEAGIPENIEQRMGIAELNRISAAVEKLIDALRQLESASGAWNNKIFGPNNDQPNWRVLGTLLQEHGLGKEVVSTRGIRGAVDLSHY